MSLPHVIFVLVAAQLKQACGVGRVVPVQHGLHLDDLLWRDVRVMRPAALIAVYDTTPAAPCAPASQHIVLDDLRRGEGLPSRAHLFIGKHDVRDLEKIWWQWQRKGDLAKYDLFRRFPLSRCPAFVYFPAVEQIDPSYDYTGDMKTWEGLDGEPPWREWLENLLERPITVFNELLLPVQVQVSKAGLQQNNFTLAPGSEQTIRALPGVRILASKAAADGTLVPLWAEMVPGGAGESCQKLNINADLSGDPFARYHADHEAMEARAALLTDRDQSTTFQHSAILKQPPVMPTRDVADSYKLVDIPKDVMERLLKFYRDHEHARSVEQMPPGHTGINHFVVNTTMVSFDRDMELRDFLAKGLIQPLLEKWVGFPLEFTALYGIREYYRNAELRMHVDRVSTHVFSVILNLDQSSVDEDWLLEVIDFDGAYKKLAMKVGQMIFYQSAKLVHGRPAPFRGGRFANAFCHFRPAERWEFDYRVGDVLWRDDKPFIDYKVD